MSEKRRRTGAVWCWPAAKFLHWKPRRREPHTPDTLRTRLRLNMLRYSVQKPHCPQCEGRDELEHLSQAGLASTLGMRRLSSPRPRSLMLHRFAPRPSTKSSADTLRIRENRRLGAAWCTSCSRAAECCAHAVSGDAPNMCVELRCESRNAGEPQRSPTRSR